MMGGIAETNILFGGDQTMRKMSKESMKKVLGGGGYCKDHGYVILNGWDSFLHFILFPSHRVV